MRSEDGTKDITYYRKHIRFAGSHNRIGMFRLTERSERSRNDH